MLYEAIISQLMASFENTHGASAQETPLTQIIGALHLKNKACWGLILNVLFLLELRVQNSGLGTMKLDFDQCPGTLQKHAKSSSF